MLKLRPPRHAHDRPALWISSSDPAWDNDRIEAERLLLMQSLKVHEAARAYAQVTPDARDLNLQQQLDHAADSRSNTPARAQLLAVAKQAQDQHPVSRWLMCETRFDLDAKMTVPERLRTAEHPETALPIRDYLLAEPTTFELRPLGARMYRRIAPQMTGGQTSWMLDAAKHGLVAIHNAWVEDGKPCDFPLERDADGSVSERSIDALHEQDKLLPLNIGAAVSMLTHFVESGVEGKL